MVPKNNFMGRSCDIGTISFSRVMEVLYTFQNGGEYYHFQNAFNVFYGTTNTDFKESRILDLIPANNFIKEFLKKVIENSESINKVYGKISLLCKNNTSDLQEFEAFGELPELIEIGKMFGMFPNEVEEQPYMLVSTIALYNAKITHNRILNEKK